ncbi:expressed unknown protein [Seminavis robusta]|uniref:Uncharacterized protein n=1 Tax=Seminavis robusta TaxID=568900 RepID=A0A9N8DYN6_9STRA|nr:expressed unknown protein [Seminavis robusta]|eukprot:Sro382_g131060.1 n/a (147) ;mRNA; r:33310-33750
MAFTCPQDDLTRLNFGHPDHNNLSDRQYFAWALRTETKIRFGKLEARHSPASEYHSTTLKSDFLIDVYPSSSGGEYEVFANQWERDKSAFERKPVDSLRETKTPDGTLRPILINGYQQMPHALSSNPDNQEGTLPVPPNFYTLKCA